MNEPKVFMASLEDAEITARMQIDFNAEFDSLCPELEELTPRFRSILAGSSGFVLLAGERGDPNGYALITLRPTIYHDGPLAVLDELYVKPVLRDRGVGTALLVGAIGEVRRRGGHEMHINVDEIDTDTRRFYERHGFINVEPETDYRMLCYIREF
ncbi:GNAT family N-acetyltransferase [Nesterenkonia salmonea]|uniref:GNAT family N-acetyltransferase n=1 Tax=Nesterenkonia salmonea TaxID=1804987 RepID=A0A5R9BDC1_9MICC|nr:GNAT family N-acetyltransferase [Nesterenkonia salmonea]TLP98604.1 GNAT family N-acetyltransferase [Nesterenkonia salmonea]